MKMIVNETRQHGLPLQIDHLCGIARERQDVGVIAYRCEDTIPDCHRAGLGLAAVERRKAAVMKNQFHCVGVLGHERFSGEFVVAPIVVSPV